MHRIFALVSFVKCYQPHPSMPSGNMHNIQLHTFGLARYTFMLLSGLCHGNGRPAAQIYADGHFDSPVTQGPILSFNLLDSNGKIIGYSQVPLMNKLLLRVYSYLVSFTANPLLPSGGQDGKFIQHPCAHRLFLQHGSLSGLHRHHQPADEEKPSGGRWRKPPVKGLHRL